MKFLLNISLASLTVVVAQAAVTYVDPVADVVIPNTFGGVYLDLVTESVSSSSQGGSVDPSGDSYSVSFSEPSAGNWDLNLFFGGAGIAHSPTFQPYRAAAADNLSAIDQLGIGTIIDGDPVTPEPVTGSSAPLSLASFGGSGSGLGGGSGVATSGDHMGVNADQFTSGTRGYIAFVLDPGTANEQFGWIGVTLFNDGSTGVIHDWAYSPDPIAVGAVPEPSAAILILVGSAFLCRRRRV